MQLRNVLLEVHRDKVKECPALEGEEYLAALADDMRNQFAEMSAVAKWLVAADPKSDDRKGRVLRFKEDALRLVHAERSTLFLLLVDYLL